MRPGKISIVGCLSFFVLFFFFFWPLLTLKKSFILGDFSVQHLPWAWHYFKSLHGGQLPYWTGGMTCGFPLLAEGQVGAFYWLNVLSYRFLPFIAAYTWSIPFHLLVGGLAMFFYARCLKLSAAASWMTAIVFAFGSGYAGCFLNAGSLRTLCWLPLALLILEKSRDASGRTRIVGIAALSVLFSQMWTAGFAQLAVYAFAYCLIHELLAGGKRAAAALWPVILSLMLGTLLALPQLLETLRLIRESTRQGESLHFALWGSVPPVAPVSLLFPEWGNTLRFSFYLGALPFCLVLGPICFSKNQKPIFRHLVLAGLFFLLALGKFNPIYVWLIKTFHLTSLRIPAKFLFFTLTSLSVLAGFGLDRILLAVERRENLKWCQRLFAALAAIAVLLPVFGQLSLKLIKSFLPDLTQGYAQRLFLEKGIHAKPVEYYQKLLADFFDNLSTLFSYNHLFNLNTIFLMTAGVLTLIAFLKGYLRKNLFIFFVFMILVLDLAVFGRFLSIGFVGNAGELGGLKPSREVSQIQSAGRVQKGAFVEFVEAHANEILPPNAGLYYGINHAGGYSPLLLKRYYELTKDLGIVDSSLGRTECSLEMWKKQRGLLDLIGARWIRSDQTLDLRDLKLLSRAPHFFLYENQAVLPKITGFYQWRIIEPPLERLDFLKSGGFDARKELVLSKPLGQEITQLPENGYAIGRVTRESSRSFQFEIEMKNDGIVMLRLAAYPGWKLRVDGKETEWFVVNHAFIGFVALGGSRHIELFYEPALKTLFHSTDLPI